MCLDRIKLIDKRNNHAVCPKCDELETWEHAMLCDKQQDNRDAWVKMLDKSYMKFQRKER